MRQSLRNNQTQNKQCASHYVTIKHKTKRAESLRNNQTQNKESESHYVTIKHKTNSARVTT